MRSDDLLQTDELPAGYTNLPEILYLCEKGLTDFEPWEVATGQSLRALNEEVTRLYPKRQLVPLTKRTDNDDVACWDRDRSCISVVHLYASPGWEQKQTYADFWALFRTVIEDFVSRAKQELFSRQHQIDG